MTITDPLPCDHADHEQHIAAVTVLAAAEPDQVKRVVVEAAGAMKASDVALCNAQGATVARTDSDYQQLRDLSPGHPVWAWLDEHPDADLVVVQGYRLARSLTPRTDPAKAGLN